LLFSARFSRNLALLFSITASILSMAIVLTVEWSGTLFPFLVATNLVYAFVFLGPSPLLSRSQTLLLSAAWFVTLCALVGPSLFMVAAAFQLLFFILALLLSMGAQENSAPFLLLPTATFCTFLLLFAALAFGALHYDAFHSFSTLLPNLQQLPAGSVAKHFSPIALLLALIVPCIFAAPFAPFHSALNQVLLGPASPVKLVWLGTGALLATHLISSWAVPLLPSSLATLAPVIRAGTMVSQIYCIGLVLTVKSIPKWIAAAFFALATFLFQGLTCFTVAGAQGAVTLSISAFLPLALLLWHSQFDKAAGADSPEKRPVSFVSLLSLFITATLLLSSFAFPGTAGFQPLVLIFRSLIETRPLEAVFAAVLWGSLGLSAFKLFIPLLYRASHPAPKGTRLWVGQILLLSVCLFLHGLALRPHFFASRIALSLKDFGEISQFETAPEVKP
jgi:hypothetical protein